MLQLKCKNTTDEVITMLGNNRIWQQNSTYCYTLPNGTYQTFMKKLTLEEIKNAFKNVDYFRTYKNYVNKNGTKFSILDKIQFYPFAMPLNTWIFSNLQYGITNFVPSYDDFCNFYIDNYCYSKNGKMYFNKNASLKDVEFTDLEMRIRIGYPFGSFLREFYLRNYLIQYFKENNVPINVCYNLYDDYYNAIDIILEKDKRVLGICVLDASSKSQEMKNIKDSSRHFTIGNDIKIGCKNGFLKNYNMIPRINFYTEVFGNNVEHLGEINVPKEEQMNVLVETIRKSFQV